MEDRIVPLEPELGAHGFVALVPNLDALRQEAKARGLWAPFLPEELGGRGLSLLEYAHVSEALGRSPEVQLLGDRYEVPQMPQFHRCPDW